MTKKYRLLAVLLAAALLLGTAVLPASAAPETAEAKAGELYSLGLFKGTGTRSDGTPEYDLGATATRSAAATMLVRLLGKESEAQSQYSAGTISAPFTDLEDWAAANVAWLYTNGLTSGTGESTYSGTSNVSAQQFATFILRALGYSDSGSNPDFSYDKALTFAVDKQVITSAQSTALQADFRREGIVEMC